MNILKPQTAKIAPIDRSTGSGNNNNNNTKHLKDSSKSHQPSNPSLTKDETLQELFQKARNNIVLNDETSFDLGSTNFLFCKGSTRKGKVEDTTGEISSGVVSAVGSSGVVSAVAGIVSGVNSTAAGIASGVTCAVAGVVSDVTIPVNNNNGNSDEEQSTTNKNNNNNGNSNEKKSTANNNKNNNSNNNLLHQRKS